MMMFLLYILAVFLLISNSEQNSTVCYDVGCFDTCYPVIAPTPNSPAFIDATLYYYNVSTRLTPFLFKYNSDNQTIINSGFDGTKKTIFIVHGWNWQYSQYNWMGTMKDYLLDQPGNYNVIPVDWSKGANQTNYFQSACDTRVTGAMLGYFINRLKIVTGLTPSLVHLVGHSLGAHAVGAAGATVKNLTDDKVYRISGLDPAGPGFTDSNNATRLDKTDGNLVDIIHSNEFDLLNPTTGLGIGFGLPDALGHYDSYANGGNQQPGCTPGPILESIYADPGAQGLNSTVFCSHERSHDLLMADPSLYNSSCQLIAYACDSWTDFENGQCASCGTGEDCKPINFFFSYWDNSSNYINGDNKTSTELYIKTGASAPFCLFHYQIVVEISQSSILNLFGIIQITFNGQTVTFGQSTFNPNQVYKKLLTLPNNAVQDLGNITTASVKWTSILLPSIPIILPASISISSVEIYFMSNIDQSIRAAKSATLCPQNEQITSGSTKQFTIGNC